jgi:hypothetical protein
LPIFILRYAEPTDQQLGYVTENQSYSHPSHLLINTDSFVAQQAQDKAPNPFMENNANAQPAGDQGKQAPTFLQGEWSKFDWFDRAMRLPDVLVDRAVSSRADTMLLSPFPAV